MRVTTEGPLGGQRGSERVQQSHRNATWDGRMSLQLIGAETSARECERLVSLYVRCVVIAVVVCVTVATEGQQAHARWKGTAFPLSSNRLPRR